MAGVVHVTLIAGTFRRARRLAGYARCTDCDFHARSGRDDLDHRSNVFDNIRARRIGGKLLRRALAARASAAPRHSAGDAIDQHFALVSLVTMLFSVSLLCFVGQSVTPEVTFLVFLPLSLAIIDRHAEGVAHGGPASGVDLDTGRIH